MNTVYARCPLCRQIHDITEPFSSFSFIGLQTDSDGYKVVWCGDCVKRSDKERVERCSKDRNPPAKTQEDVWRDICPVEYRTEQEGGFTDSARVWDEFDSRNANGEEWDFHIVSCMSLSKPMLIAGPPGSMKTRTAWRIARDYHDKSIPVYAFTCWSFQAAAQKAAGEYRSEEWLKSLLKGFILIDDLGKSPWTDYTAATFFELVEQVVAHHGKLVITANDSSVELAESIGQRKTISPEIGAGILRRIREHFLRVVAVKPNTP